MLLNFCRKCFQSNVVCSTVSNDGFEVTNLTSDSDKGFLAYSCIKPPIHIDFTFICEVKINHVLIWPSVGAQKSSGFEISIKCSNDYKRISSGFLSSEHSGLLFYRRDTVEKSSYAPPNFLRRYMQLSQSQILNSAKSLRISILKTENSVPAIGRVEIWGGVSPFCTKETIGFVYNLWLSSQVQIVRDATMIDAGSSQNAPEITGKSTEEQEGKDVPDCFLDPITWNIMIQPIVLPSGAIIDQSTLEKHGKSEAKWGRTLSDPFTGLPLNETRKPIIASALKARIDKYLLENKHSPDVKSMPRLSGRKQTVMSLRNRSLDISEIASENNIRQNLTNRASLKTDESMELSKEPKKFVAETSRSNVEPENRVHRLPILIPVSSKRVIAKSRSKTFKIKSLAVSAFKTETSPAEKGEIEKNGNLESSVQTVLSNLRRFDEEKETATKKCRKNCKCSSNVFYKLPCDHILCRDVLISISDSRCCNCSAKYDSRDLERIHGVLPIE